MKNVLIFGAGKVGCEMIHAIEKKYHILFVVDNDKGKWGSVFEGYEVKSPEEILLHNCDIIILSKKYVMEILDQLRKMEISKDRIYFYEVCFNDDKINYEIIPLNPLKLVSTDKKLSQYDLLNKKEEETERKKVLIFCTFYSVYTKQVVANICKRYSDIEFSLLTKAEESKDELGKWLKHIYVFRTKNDLKTILEQIPIYDAMQLLWIEHEWAYFYELIRGKAKRLNLNVGGSDFYRVDKAKRDFKRNLIACADSITAETSGTLQEFQEFYREEVGNKMGLLPFGVEVLDYIKRYINNDKNEIRQKYGITPDKIIVTCGHNAGKAHQHIKIIEAIDRMPDDIKQKIICVFPMTYGKNEEYINEIRDHVCDWEVDHLILTDFMDLPSMAGYALISDIMIHVQTTDQLSSTMLEEMYAGSIVIAGQWLPYRSLHEMGIYFIDVDTIPDVTEVLEDVVTNIDAYRVKCKGNAELIWQHSSWEALAPKWHALWD